MMPFCKTMPRGTVTVEKKRCPKCGKTKKASEFYKSKWTKSGLMSRCKECTLND